MKTDKCVTFKKHRYFIGSCRTCFGKMKKSTKYLKILPGLLFACIAVFVFFPCLFLSVSIFLDIFLGLDLKVQVFVPCGLGFDSVV